MSESKSLTPAQEAAIAEINSNLQIIACAGSGKTEVIARRIANILESKENILPESIPSCKASTTGNKFPMFSPYCRYRRYGDLP